MIKDISEKSSLPVEIDLTGPEGNAFVLLGLAERWSKELGIDPIKVKREMTEKNYDNLIRVMDKYFGEWVIFYR